ncbi:hypothetical protein ACFO1B_57350, partial [Dactylosporangium siamense]|uniref:hypothetical protein n=1 Tax=Dactylosporangium siamense TaxID=685454 RepID=UPI0031E59E60
MTMSVAARPVAERAHVSGVVFSAARADGGGSAGRVALDVSYAGFADVFGGGYGSRLRLVSMPGCVLSTPEVAACQVQTPVSGSVNTVSTRVVSADAVTVAGDPGAVGSAQSAGGAQELTVFALTAEVSSASAGNFAATSLSAAYGWSQGGSSGSFGYGYPITVPDGLGGPEPDVSLGYSSGSVDGRTSGANGQPSWLGDGW